MRSYNTEFTPVYSTHQLESKPIKHGIAPLKVKRTPYITKDIIPDLDYWRDLPSKAAMLSRWEKYTLSRQFQPRKDAFHSAVNKVKTLWKNFYGENLRVKSTMASYYDLPKSTSAGLPFPSGATKGSERNRLITLARRQWNRINNKQQLLVLPCRAGARCQLRMKGENKPRLIWAYPGYISIIENQYLLALKEMEPPPFMGWSINWLDNGVSLNRLIFGDGNSWSSLAQIDFSSFDSSISKELTMAAFSIFRSLFNLSDSEAVMLDQLKHYFIYTPLAMYNEIKVKNRGIPSGSVFTQVIGSIINMIACTYASECSREYNLRMEYSCWLGDDSFLNFKEALCKDEFDYHYLRYFKDLALDVSDEKTHYVTRWIGWTDAHMKYKRRYAKFLGKQIDLDDATFHTNIGKLDAQMVLPEKPDLSRFETGVRLIGLVWAYGMHYDVYLRILRVYLSLKLPDTITVQHLIKESTKPEKTMRNLNYFFSALKYQLNINIDSTELLSFPKFWDVSNRYFGAKYERLDFRSYKIVEKEVPNPTSLPWQIAYM